MQKRRRTDYTIERVSILEFGANTDSVCAGGAPCAARLCTQYTECAASASSGHRLASVRHAREPFLIRLRRPARALHCGCERPTGSRPRGASLASHSARSRQHTLGHLQARASTVPSVRVSALYRVGVVCVSARPRAEHGRSIASRCSPALRRGCCWAAERVAAGTMVAIAGPTSHRWRPARCGLP